MQETSTHSLVDWENRKEIGFLNGFIRSLKKSLFEPSAFFRSVSPEGDYTNPLFYALICLTLGSLPTIFYGLFFESLNLLQPILHRASYNLVLSPFIALVTVMIIPVIGFFHLFVYSAVYHLFLWMVGGNKKGYEATFRAFAYAQGPQFFQIVPLIGPFIAIVWSYVLLVIGFREVQGISTGKSLFATLLPLLILFSLLILLVIVVVILVMVIGVKLYGMH